MKNFNSRNEELKSKFNKHFQVLTGLETDFYSALKDEDILELKTILSDINNLLTYKLTLVAGKWLSEYFLFNRNEQQLILEKIDSTKPNAQGFDIVIYDPIKIIAEVKCNVPVKGGSKFGAMQSKKLIEDVQKLLTGKRHIADTSKYLKFLFIINIGNRSQEAIIRLSKKTKIRKENEERLMRNITRENMIIMTDETSSKLKLDKVYLKVLELK